MSAAELLAELSSLGVALEVSGDRLRVKGPKGAITHELHEALTNSKQQLITLINSGKAEAAWRVTAMLPQVPENGPLPFLVAREAVEPQEGCCLSCGDSLNQDDAYRCAACSRAANLAIEMAVSLRTGTQKRGRVD
jgi:hypothetical protein